MMLEDNDDTKEEIPVPTISSAHMTAIIEYAEHYNFEKKVDIDRPLRSNDLFKCVKD